MDTPKSKNIRVAVIGIGNMGKNHARTYFDLTETTLVAVADLDQNLGKAAAEKYGCVYHSDYNDMLRSEEIDAVSIVVPTKLHKTVALDCIHAGKHVLLEKPIAPSIEDAREIIEAAKEANVRLMIGHIERFNPAVLKMKRLISSGGLGDIVSIVAKRVGLFPPQIKDSDVIVDLGIHDIDIFNFLLERQPSNVLTTGGSALTNRRADHAELMCLYDGIGCFIQTNWVTPIKIRTLSVTGTKGHAELDYITQKFEVYKSNYEKAADNYGEFLIRFGEPDKIEVPVNNDEPLKLEIANFISSIRSGRPLGMTGEEARAALAIALSAVESLKTGRMVAI